MQPTTSCTHLLSDLRRNHGATMPISRLIQQFPSRGTIIRPQKQSLNFTAAPSDDIPMEEA
jgi:hypothetical protein